MQPKGPDKTRDDCSSTGSQTRPGGLNADTLWEKVGWLHEPSLATGNPVSKNILLWLDTHLQLIALPMTACNEAHSSRRLWESNALRAM